MRGNVRRIVKICPTCQQQKNAHHPEGITRRRLYTGRSWQRIAVYFTGPLDEAPRGNKWILAITDHFTRWCDAYPLLDTTAETAAQILAECVFSQFDIPENIHSDQGRQFQSKLFTELCQLWGCNKTQTTPYQRSKTQQELGRCTTHHTGGNRLPYRATGLAPTTINAEHTFCFPHNHRRDCEPHHARQRGKATG